MNALLAGRARTVCHAMESALRCAEAARAPTDVVGSAVAAVRELEGALAAARVDDDVIGRAGRAYDALERWRAEQGGAIPGYYLG